MQVNRVKATIDNGGGHNLLVDTSLTINQVTATNRMDGQSESKDYLDAPEVQELLEMQDNEKTSDKNSIIPPKEKPDQLTRFLKGKLTDQLAAYRRDYHIPFDFGLENTIFWQNHEGSKLVALQTEIKDDNTILTFKLYDNRYCELYPSQQYEVIIKIYCWGFELSPDEQYLLILGGKEDYKGLFFCYFENGFENDIFIEREMGQHSLDKMSFKPFKLNEFEFRNYSNISISKQRRLYDLRISNLNHLFVLRFGSFYKSKLTISELINHFKGNNYLGEKELRLRDDFDIVIMCVADSTCYQRALKVDGPFVVAFDDEKQMFQVHNYEEEEFYEWEIEDQTLLLQDQQKLGGENIFVNLILNEGSFSWHFFFFCPKKLYIFSHKDNKISPMNNGFTFDREVSQEVRKIISLEAIICQDMHSIYFYKINWKKSQIELLHKNKGDYKIDDLMKQSSLIYDSQGKTLLNFYSSPFEKCVSTIAMTQSSDDDIVGINCFGELLLRSELISYATNNFSHQILGDKLIFYSKRLNLYVYRSGNQTWVKYLNGGIEDIFSNQPEIKSLQIENRENLRIFKHHFKDMIILLPFFNDNSVKGTIYQTQDRRDSVFIFSENSDEIAVISRDRQIKSRDRQLTILKINEKHEFYVSGEGQVKEFQGIQIDEVNSHTRFLHRILIIGTMLVRFSEDYSQIVAVKKLGYDDIEIHHYFQSQNKWLIIRMNTSYHIFDIENLKLKMLITNCEELDLDNGSIIQDYQYKQRNDHCLYRSYQIPGTSKRILRRTQLVDANMIFGVPLSIADKPFFVTVFDMKSKYLYYHPMNPEGSIDLNAPLTCTQLRFNIDSLTEYQGIEREYKIIENIKNVESLIVNFTGYDVLHHAFFLQKLLQYPNANKILSHLMKKLQLNSDQDKLMPYLMFEDRYSSSPLKLALEKQNSILVNEFMELCINQDKQGLLYSAQFSPLLFEMKTLGIDLKPLFASRILFHKIDNQNPNFDEFDQDLKYCIIHSNAKNLYDVLYGEKLVFEKKEENKQAQNIEYYVVNMKDQISYEEGQEKSKESKIQKVKQIIQLFDELSNGDLTYLEIELVQVIINFKWKKYTFNHFLNQFCLLLLFTLSLITDVCFGIKQYQLENDYGFYVTRGICQSILIWFLTYEIFQLIKEKFDYFSSLWNILDFSLQLLYPAYIFVSFYWKSHIYAIKLIQSGIIILTFIKILFFLRIFRQFSFLIQMLGDVFRDMSTFLYFFGIVIGFFSILLGVLINDLDDYEGIGPVGYFTIAMRQALGDYVTDSFAKNSDFKVFTWVIYLMVMILGNVVFMNFIIAVISQSYENCMQKSTAQSYKVKLDMIRERESLMDENDFKNKEWFPNYIILCKPISERSNADSGNIDNEWGGVLREMEKVVKRQIQMANQQQKKITNAMNDRIEILSNEVKNSAEEMKKLCEEMKKKRDNNMDYMEKNLKKSSEEKQKSIEEKEILAEEKKKLTEEKKKKRDERMDKLKNNMKKSSEEMKISIEEIKKKKDEIKNFSNMSMF